MPPFSQKDSSSSRLRRILTLGLPIMGGMVSQNILNLVDTAMVGQLGDAALAAVGMSAFVNFTLGALVIGVSAGVQAIVSRRMGEGRAREAAESLNAALVIVVAFTLPWSLLWFQFAPAIMGLMTPDPAVVAEGVPYLQARMVGMTAMGVNYAFRGFWNGISRSGLYLRTLLVMHVVNVAISYVLIFGAFGAPRLGTMGAGIGTTAATFVGSAYYVLLGLRYAKGYGFLRARPVRATLLSVIRLSLPSGISTLFFAGGQAALFWILGRVGTAELAAASVLLNVSLVALLPAMGLGMAGATLVGHALGRGDPADAARWGWQVVAIAMVGLALLGVPMWSAPVQILRLFISEPSTVEMARPALQLMGAMLAFEAVSMVLNQALLGAGAARLSMVVSLSFQWGIMLPAVYLVGPVLGLGLFGMWATQGVARIVQGVVVAGLWRRGSWMGLKV